MEGEVGGHLHEDEYNVGRSDAEARVALFAIPECVEGLFIYRHVASSIVPSQLVALPPK
jgi:hypothetical protein